jgi:signal peptidase II
VTPGPPGDPDRTGQRSRGWSRGRLAGWLYGWAVAVYGLDRLTKFLAETYLQGRPPVHVIPGVVQLDYTTNPGGAFGVLGGATWLFLTATLVVCAAIVVASFNLPSRLIAAGLGLVLGGALGNLTDRAVRGGGFSGRVVDFIDFRWWPVFNAADSAIVIGAALIILSGFLRSPGQRRASGRRGATG